jgi:hypothetical protein
MGNAKSNISKTTLDRQKFFHILTQGTEIHLYIKLYRNFSWLSKLELMPQFN